VSLYHYINGTLSSLFSIGKSNPATIDASGLTAPRTYTFQDKSGAFVLANQVFPQGTTTISVPEDFATVGEATTYLSECFFLPYSFVRLVVNSSEDITLETLNLPYVSIYMSAYRQDSGIPVSGVASVTGSSGNYLVTFNTAQASEFAVNDDLLVSGLALVGTGVFQALAGVCRVTATTASTITCLYKYYKATTFPAFTLTSGRIYRPIASPVTQRVLISNCTLDSITLCVDSTTITYSSINAVNLYSTNNNVDASLIQNSNINMLEIYAGGSTYPFNIKQSHISQLVGAWSCNSAGLTISLDSTVILTSGDANSFCVMGNNAIGMLVEDSKVLWEGSAGCPISAKHNLTYDIRATGCGYVRATSILNSPSLNPTANTIGNGNALIRTF